MNNFFYKCMTLLSLYSTQLLNQNPCFCFGNLSRNLYIHYSIYGASKQTTRLPALCHHKGLNRHYINYKNLLHRLQRLFFDTNKNPSRQIDIDHRQLDIDKIEITGKSRDQILSTVAHSPAHILFFFPTLKAVPFIYYTFLHLLQSNSYSFLLLTANIYLFRQRKRAQRES